VRGTRIDYTTAPVGRAVILLAVPMVVEMSMESILHQPLRLLAVRDPAGVVPRHARRLRRPRRVHRLDGVVLDAGGGERAAIQAWRVEDEKGVMKKTGGQEIRRTCL